MDKEQSTGINHVFAVIYLFAVFLIAVGCEKKPTATTPLHDAAQTGDIEQVQALILSGADVNAKNNNGLIPGAFLGLICLFQMYILLLEWSIFTIK